MLIKRPISEKQSQGEQAFLCLLCKVYGPMYTLRFFCNCLKVNILTLHNSGGTRHAYSNEKKKVFFYFYNCFNQWWAALEFKPDLAISQIRWSLIWTEVDLAWILSFFKMVHLDFKISEFGVEDFKSPNAPKGIFAQHTFGFDQIKNRWIWIGI